MQYTNYKQQIDKIIKTETAAMKKQGRKLPSTSVEVILFLGSFVNILPTRSLALSDIEGHGSLSKSTFSLSTASNMPCSVSA